MITNLGYRRRLQYMVDNVCAVSIACDEMDNMLAVYECIINNAEFNVCIFDVDLHRGIYSNRRLMDACTRAIERGVIIQIITSGEMYNWNSPWIGGVSKLVEIGYIELTTPHDFPYFIVSDATRNCTMCSTGRIARMRDPDFSITLQHTFTSFAELSNIQELS